MRQSHFPNSRGELNMSVPSVRRSMESSLGANVSAFVDIENDLLDCWDGGRTRCTLCTLLMPSAGGPPARNRVCSRATKAASATLPGASSFGLGVQHFPESLPRRAGPSLQPHLRPDHVLGFAGVDLDPKQRSRDDNVFQVLGLCKNVLA